MRILRALRREDGLAAAAGAAFAACALFHPASVYRSPAAMDGYFGQEITPGSWSWPGSWSSTEAPYKYRVLFKGLVDHLAEGLGLVLPHDLGTYWLALVIVTALSVVFATVACRRFLAAAGAGGRAQALLVAGWFLMPPVHDAFVLPVQTKEDFLAYGLLFLALTALLQERFRPVVLWTLAGALTRETLMIIPGVLLIGSRAPRGVKLLGLGVGVACHAGLRLGLGMTDYEVTRSENFDHALLVAVSLAAVLGYAWLVCLPRLGWGALRRDAGWILASLRGAGPGSAARQRLEACFLPVLGLLVLAHLFMGRIVEVRISLLIAPWVLLMLAEGLERADLRRALPQAAVAAVVMAAAILLAERAGLLSQLRGLVNPQIPGFGAQVWWLEAEAQLVLAAALAALLRTARSVRSAVS